MNLFLRTEAAEYLGISTRTLDRLTHSREITFIQPAKGCRVQFSQKALDEYLTRNTKKVRKAKEAA